MKWLQILINEYGATLLYRAIDGGYINILRFLLNHNANIYGKGKIICNDKGNIKYVYYHSDTELSFAKYKLEHYYSKQFEAVCKEIIKLLEKSERKNSNPNAKVKHEKKSILKNYLVKFILKVQRRHICGNYKHKKIKKR